MKNSITKQSRGITLIALIITIVVLLILAVVAIGAAQESNIVGYAQNAATKYEQAQDNEIGLISTYENILSKYDKPETSEWTTYGTQQEYFLVGTNTLYYIIGGNIKYTFDIKEDKKLEEYFNFDGDSTYQIDETIKDISKIAVGIFNEQELPQALIKQGNIYTLKMDIVDSDNKLYSVTINKTYSVNNQVNYSSILDQI